LFPSAALGVSVAVLPLRATEAATGEPPAGVKVKQIGRAAWRERALEKVAVGATLVATPVALFAGLFAVTVGAAFTVVNCQLYALASATPSAAFTVVSNFAVYVVLFTSAELGVSVAVLPLRATEAATGEPPAGVKVKLLLVIVEASIDLEKVAVGATLVATPVALFARSEERRVGAACTARHLQVYA